MPEPLETVEQAAAASGRRWRTVAVGLALVGVTNLANAAMNAVQLGERPAVICVAAINDPALAKQATYKGLDQQGRGLTVPQR